MAYYPSLFLFSLPIESPSLDYENQKNQTHDVVCGSYRHMAQWVGASPLQTLVKASPSGWSPESHILPQGRLKDSHMPRQPLEAGAGALASPGGAFTGHGSSVQPRPGVSGGADGTTMAPVDPASPHHRCAREQTLLIRFATVG